LFQFEWFELDGKRTELKDDGFFKSIIVRSLWYKNDCYILVTQATKFFYLPDTRFGKNSKLYKHLNTDIFTMLTKPRHYNIMLLHIKGMPAAKSRACKNQFLTSHMTNL
jgi:hypothetical protein